MRAPCRSVCLLFPAQGRRVSPGASSRALDSPVPRPERSSSPSVLTVRNRVRVPPRANAMDTWFRVARRTLPLVHGDAGSETGATRPSGCSSGRSQSWDPDGRDHRSVCPPSLLHRAPRPASVSQQPARVRDWGPHPLCVLPALCRSSVKFLPERLARRHFSKAAPGAMEGTQAGFGGRAPGRSGSRVLWGRAFQRPLGREGSRAEGKPQRGLRCCCRSAGC